MRRVLLIAFLLALSPLTLPAHTLVPASFSELVESASLIVRGLVTDARAVPDPLSGISTMATVSVASTLKGDSGRFVSVRLPGGEIGTRRVTVVGAPRARVGDEAVWFLSRGADGVWTPVGLSMGIFRLAGTGRTGVVVEPPDLSAAADAGALKRGYGARRSLAVPEFEALVRLFVDAPARRTKTP